MDGNSLAEEDFRQVDQLLPKIRVLDPFTHELDDGQKHTTYRISVQTSHPSFHLTSSSIHRRFSEVIWLYGQLRTHLKNTKFPTPPSKTIFASRFETEFISQRQQDIETFLNQLMYVEGVIADFAFHLFLQTDLTPAEMGAYLEGSLSEDVVEKAWQNHGLIHSSVEHRAVNQNDFVASIDEILTQERQGTNSPMMSLNWELRRPSS